MWPYPVSLIVSKFSFSLIRSSIAGVGVHKRTPLLYWNEIHSVNKSSTPKSIVPEPEIHPVGQSRAAQPGFGKIYDKKPFKFSCIKGKKYHWCTCGHSKSQPFCDLLCINQHFKITMRSVTFIAPESKEYWFCNCKQTLKRPFCDGTHRREDVISAVRV